MPVTLKCNCGGRATLRKRRIREIKAKVWFYKCLECGVESDHHAGFWAPSLAEQDWRDRMKRIKDERRDERAD